MGPICHRTQRERASERERQRKSERESKRASERESERARERESERGCARARAGARERDRERGRATTSARERPSGRACVRERACERGSGGGEKRSTWDATSARYDVANARPTTRRSCASIVSSLVGLTNGLLLPCWPDNELGSHLPPSIASEQLRTEPIRKMMDVHQRKPECDDPSPPRSQPGTNS